MSDYEYLEALFDRELQHDLYTENGAKEVSEGKFLGPKT